MNIGVFVEYICVLVVCHCHVTMNGNYISFVQYHFSVILQFDCTFLFDSIYNNFFAAFLSNYWLRKKKRTKIKIIQQNKIFVSACVLHKSNAINVYTNSIFDYKISFFFFFFFRLLRSYLSGSIHQFRILSYNILFLLRFNKLLYLMYCS